MKQNTEWWSMLRKRKKYISLRLLYLSGSERVNSIVPSIFQVNSFCLYFIQLGDEGWELKKCPEFVMRERCATISFKSKTFALRSSPSSSEGNFFSPSKSRLYRIRILFVRRTSFHYSGTKREAYYLIFTPGIRFVYTSRK